jgi:signal transduction histidine kinase
MATYGAGTHAEVTVSDGNDNRIYEATVSPFLDLTGGSMARLIVWFEVTEAKAAQAELERQRAALAASIERDRVARELHDGLAQTLAFVKMQAQAARDALERDCADQAFEDISAMLPVVQDAHEEIRDFMLGAKRAPRDAGNFWAAVADFTERFSSVYGLKVYTVIPPEVGRLKIDPLTQVQLLRVIQESLSNVRKHARVQSASLTFSADKQCLRVVIHDDGIGFDKDSVAGAEAGHYGLMIMRERAEEIRGHVDIISEQGKGTAVFVEVPLGGKDKERSRAFAASR